MAQFVSSFITGFQDVVKEDLQKRFPKIKILRVLDGLIHYQYDGNSHDLENIIYFNNTFFVIKAWNPKNGQVSFNQMVGEVAKSKTYLLISKGTFRCRFIQENQFAKVDKNVVRKAEETVTANSKLTIDRVSPSTEIWYSIRREGFAFCGELISKREFTEKNLNQGELRPELAYLVCSFAEFPKDAVLLEPFAGYGSIPVQLAKKFQFEKLFVSELENEKVLNLKARKQLNNDKIDVRQSDAFNLSHIEDNSVNCVITDPPWGFFEDVGDITVFYKKMFDEFKRVLKVDGQMIILSARKAEIEKAAEEKNIQILDSLHTLVNGKKAGVYKMKFD